MKKVGNLYSCVLCFSSDSMCTGSHKMGSHMQCGLARILGWV